MCACCMGSAPKKKAKAKVDDVPMLENSLANILGMSPVKDVTDSEAEKHRINAKLSFNDVVVRSDAAGGVITEGLNGKRRVCKRKRRRYMKF